MPVKTNSTNQSRKTWWKEQPFIYWLFDQSRFSNIFTLKNMTMECIELNLLCKQTKKVRNSHASISINSFTESSKTHFFLGSIVNMLHRHTNSKNGEGLMGYLRYVLEVCNLKTKLFPFSCFQGNGKKFNNTSLLLPQRQCWKWDYLEDNRNTEIILLLGNRGKVEKQLCIYIHLKNNSASTFIWRNLSKKIQIYFRLLYVRVLIIWLVHQ